jgi:hypothetical protein
MNSVILEKQGNQYLYNLDYRNEHDKALSTLALFLAYNQAYYHNFLDEFLLDPNEKYIQTISYLLKKKDSTIFLQYKSERDKVFTTNVQSFRKIINEWIKIVNADPKPTKILITQDDNKISLTPYE